MQTTTKRRRAAGGVAALGGLLIGLGAWAWSMRPLPPSAALAARGAASRIYLDADGRPALPPAALPEQAEPSGAATPARGLVQRQAPLKIEPAPGGGSMVRLSGQLDHDSTATLSADGRVTGSCGRANAPR